MVDVVLWVSWVILAVVVMVGVIVAVIDLFAAPCKWIPPGTGWARAPGDAINHWYFNRQYEVTHKPDRALVRATRLCDDRPVARPDMMRPALSGLTYDEVCPECAAKVAKMYPGESAKDGEA